MQVDVAIFGGGIAGLWLLHELSERNYSVVLLEAGDLGQGQTITSQGIIHGGLKYTLQGLLTSSARNIREMPRIWSECLAGLRTPNLEHTRIRSPFCYLWRTETVSSRLGMIGAKFGLQTKPRSLDEDDIPEVLKQCPGTVAKVDEPVLAPESLLAVLAGTHRDRILKIDPESGLRFQIKGPGKIHHIKLLNPQTDEFLTLEPKTVVFTAGAGNQKLLKQVELPAPDMQRRPLHMVMLRGELPVLNGHCVDGAKTRVTITTDKDAAEQTIWQVGGQVSEDGVSMQPPQLLHVVRQELESVIPGLDLSGIEGATYRVDRAEGKTPQGKRPDNVQTYQQGNVITAWPAKLALAPQLALDVLSHLPEPQYALETLPTFWPRPTIAAPPWETAEYWWPLTGTSLLFKAG